MNQTTIAASVEQYANPERLCGVRIYQASNEPGAPWVLDGMELVDGVARYTEHRESYVSRGQAAAASLSFSKRAVRHSRPMYPEPLRTRGSGIQAVARLWEQEEFPGSWGENEYLRGQIETLADLFGSPWLVEVDWDEVKEWYYEQVKQALVAEQERHNQSINPEQIQEPTA